MGAAPQEGYLVLVSSTEDVQIRLLQMHREVLTKGPFPTHDCSVAELSDLQHGELVLHLAGIVGIASHGASLRTIGAGRREEFRKMVNVGFYERWPELRERITAERTPVLFHLLKVNEDARLMIRNLLAP